MADAGASEMIILVASLLVAGIASVVLIDAWDGVATANGDVVNARAANMETEISFGGDPANVPYDDNSDKITLFLVNTGQRNLDRTTLGLFVNGDAYGAGTQLDTSGVALAAGYVWGPGDMIMIELDDQDGNNGAGPFHGLADDSALQISMVVESVTIQGHSGTSSQTLSVRLHDVT